MVILKTNFGDIKIALHADKAPKTVENFLNYVKSGFYDNTIFHRVIDGFMIQGGGFTPDMEQKSVQNPIENEAPNGLENTIGAIAMARTPDPHSATSQFFINVNNNDFLNFKAKTTQYWGYCVFAEVVEGMDIVNKIKSVPTGSFGGHQDVPLESVVIESAVVES